ncbi:unnamed protein product [Ilex paraguariensis]|uniref:RING-type E3 ubiquitin transferase n=1 Tax=Ilex paraguariensis TaxID=185542 RepID=A0ABC8SSG7_9AQUA
MGSIDTPNPWAPYASFRDCSQGICSIYCQQWCSIIFTPPPDPPNDSGTTFSPLIIAVIVILASAFILVSYYTVIRKYCRRRGNRNPSLEFDPNQDQVTQSQWQVGSTGLDESIIKSITVCKYKKGEGLIEGTDCAVCLSEFQENESLRLLPKCNHAFHLPCIDTWLKSHSNCPLCRSNVISMVPLPSPPQNPHNFSTLNISAFEIQQQNDLILVVDDHERGHREEVVVSLVSDDLPKNSFQASCLVQNCEIGQEGVQQQFRRSISLGSFSSQRRLLISDILQIGEDDEDLRVENTRFSIGIGSSKDPPGDHSRSAMNRSISTGKFMVTRHDKGKNSVLPT